MEELLNKLIEGQERTEKRLDSLQEEMRSNFKELKADIQDVKVSIDRIERYQEETIMSMLVHVKKQVDVKEDQIQVLNRRLFDVETKTQQ